MNPLQYVPFNQTLYFINGDDPEQIEWMKRQSPLPRWKTTLSWCRAYSEYAEGSGQSCLL